MQKTIFMVCSKHQYGFVEPVASQLRDMGYRIIYPNYFDSVGTEDFYRANRENHAKWKAEALRKSVSKVESSDILLVVNTDIEKGKGYIGGATLLEMYEGFRQFKKILVLYKIPDCLYTDELLGIVDMELNGDIRKVNDYE